MDLFNGTGRRVCVIGAGIAGLVTAKVLRDDDFEVVGAGKSALDSATWSAQMEREISCVHAWAEHVFPARPEGYFVGPFLAHYIDELMRDMRLEPFRARHVFSEYFAPLWPSRYRDVGQERRRARLAASPAN
jgi:hypothetical protein